jgi:hypothetical protein
MTDTNTTTASTDNTELDQLRQQLASLKGENTTLHRSAAIRAAVEQHGSPWESVDAACKLIDDQFEFDAAERKLQPKNVFARSVDEVVNQFAAANSYLVRNTAAATGDTPNLRQLFGAKSIGRMANDLAQRDPGMYRRLKAQARKESLI